MYSEQKIRHQVLQIERKKVENVENQHLIDGKDIKNQSIYDVNLHP